MKNILLITLILLSFSCKEDDDKTLTTPIVDTFDPTDTTDTSTGNPVAITLLKQGTLIGVGHTVVGTVKIYDDSGKKKVVVLDPFSSQNGPDLKVYLSKDQNASQYINLGPLKSTTGKQSYDISGMPDLGEYKFVLIWCQQFSVLFGKAELQ